MGNFRLVAREKSGSPSDEERERARDVLFFAKLQLEARDPDAVAAARALTRDAGRPTDGRPLAELVETIEVSILSGQLVFEEQRKVGLPSLQPSAVPPSSRPAHSPREEIVPTSFEVRWIDEIGEPIVGLDVAFSVSGRRETKKTGGDGVAHFTDPGGSNFAFADPASLDALREAVGPRWDTIREGELVTEADALVFELRNAAEGVQLESDVRRTISVQPFVSRTRLLGAFFDTSKSFILPGGIPGIRALVSNFDAEAHTKLLIVGHTDLAGAQSYNDVLSLERANALKDYLTDNVDGWLELYGKGIPGEKRWGPKEDLLMIDALPDEPTRDPAEAPVRWFQRTRGLTLDGSAGPETRAQLITEYMALAGTSLPDGIAPVTHGCGENFPADATPDGESDPGNRRVEVFFFDGALGVQPPPPGSNSAPGSPEFPEWVKRSRRTDDHEAVDGPESLEIRLHDASSKPLKNATGIVTLGSRRTPVDADDKGFITVLLPLVCPAEFHVDWGPEGSLAPFPFTYDLVAHCDEGDGGEQDRNRLNNLGYSFDLSFEVAAVRFQADYHVDDQPEPGGLVNGALPPASHAKLKAIFEGDCDASM